MNNERSVPRCDQVYLHLSIFISFVPILRLSECGLSWYFWFWAWFFHLKWSKLCKKIIFLSTRNFCRLEILSTRNISESNFSKLRFWTVDKYIFIYGEDISPPFVFDLVSEHDKSNLMFSQWSRSCPLMRSDPRFLSRLRLTFAIFLPFEAILCIQYKFSLIWKNALFLTIDVLRGEVGLRSAACAGNDLAIRAVSQNLP